MSSKNNSNNTIFTVIVAVANAAAVIFKFLLTCFINKFDKKVKKEEELKNLNEKLDDVCDNGNISNLIDITHDIGNAKK